MKKTVTAALVAVGISLPAWGQEAPCAPRDTAVKNLASKYGEAVQSMAMNSVGNIVEMYANLDTGSWSLVITLPDGRACLAMSGQAYEGGIVMPAGDPL